MTQLIAQADATCLPLADASVDMVFTSPPYMDARTYGINAHRGCEDWVAWMLDVVTELTRVCRGLVLVNCAGVTRDRCYWPGCEGLMYEWWKRGGNLWRPAYWHRVGIPGSGGKQWLRADIEYVIPFKRDAEWLPWSDNTANGHPPKWAPGGEMSHRLGDGARVNQWGKNGSRKGMGARKQDGTFAGCDRPSHIDLTGRGTPFGNRQSTVGRRPDGTRKSGYFNGNSFGKPHTKSLANGEDDHQFYVPPVLANPGVLIQGIKVGGGLMGSKLAHQNEAPFPEALAEWFIKSWCPPGGTVLDCFSGSGTTVAVAKRLGRRGIGTDLRFNQCELGRRRLSEPLKLPKAKRVPPPAPGESLLFEVA